MLQLKNTTRRAVRAGLAGVCLLGLLASCAGAGGAGVGDTGSQAPVSTSAPNREAQTPAAAPTGQPVEEPNTSAVIPAESAQLPASTAAEQETAAAGSPFELDLIPVAQELDNPVHATHAGDGSGRLFVVEKEGRIRVVAGDALQPEPFLDITDVVGANGSEQGLLSVAFHPDFEENRFLYVNYTDTAGDTVIARYQAVSDGATADPASAKSLLQIDQPFPNHNGGQIAFGPDGYLYIGMGDGGGAGDPLENGQNLESMLGKLLRIDVDGGDPYAVPPDNPFVDQDGARPEIWALGLRNPWRFSFDRTTGDLFIADVGQGAREEVHFQPSEGGGGLNYGWNTLEGSGCYDTADCDQTGLELPVAEYSHDLGCTIVGGFRYRGEDVPAFGNSYFFADYCSGLIWALDQDADGSWRQRELSAVDMSISSFGEDEQGELYLADLGGALYRLGAAP